MRIGESVHRAFLKERECRELDCRDRNSVGESARSLPHKRKERDKSADEQKVRLKEGVRYTAVAGGIGGRPTRRYEKGDQSTGSGGG